MQDFTQSNQTECIELLNKEVSRLREELEYYKESERALKDVLRNMVSKVQTNSWLNDIDTLCGIHPARSIRDIQ